MRSLAITASVSMLLAGCSADDPSGGAGESDASAGGSATETGSASAGSGSATTGASATSTAAGTVSDSGTTAAATGTGTAGTTSPAEPFCGDGEVDPGEACDDGNDDPFDGCFADCSAAEPLAPPALKWEYFEIPGTVCMDGSPAGFAVNHNPDSADLMIYLEGGGACFSDSCDFTSFNIPFVPPIDGIFSRSSDANPVKDWSMVYVPYCTGDIHAGDAEATLGGQVRHFRGYSNITRYLEVLVPSLPAERVLLTGISAGGFGAALNATQVADAYGDQVELTVIDDSGPPLSDAVIPPCLQAIFRDLWDLESTILADCDTCDPDDFATGLIDHVLTNHPDIRFGVFSNTADAIISTYMGAGWGNGKYDNCGGLSTPVPPLVYSGDLTAIRAQHMAEASTFYKLGIGHTALRVGFNTTVVGGTSLPAWIADVLAGEITHVGP